MKHIVPQQISKYPMASGYVDPRIFKEHAKKIKKKIANAFFELVNLEYQRRSCERISISHKSQKYVKKGHFHWAVHLERARFSTLFITFLDVFGLPLQHIQKLEKNIHNGVAPQPP